MTETRQIRVQALARVEGEGGLEIDLENGAVRDVRLRIFEPPRFFEAFLRGRSLNDVPDIVARICGICPVAYQMSAVHAIEAALGAQVSPFIRRLRRLLYCGEWIESHALHMHLLHAPDFFGRASGLELAQTHPEELRRGLRLKKHGNELLDVLGGRAIHPINVRVGGFHRAPKADEFARLIPDFEWGLDAAVQATRWAATFPFPEFTPDYEFVAVTHPDEYAMNEGSITSSTGEAWPAHEFESVFEERQAPHSTALHAVRRDTGSPYLVGPLARVNLSFSRLSPIAQEVAASIGFELPCRNPFRAIIARGLEVIHAYDEALQILRNYQAEPPRVAVPHRAAEGCAATEAPRGLLYHRYRLNDEGRVEFAKIVPPTSQNQLRIETDLRAWLPDVLSEPDDVVARTCENVVRNHDPCISCSTHFLRVRIARK